MTLHSNYWQTSVLGPGNFGDRALSALPLPLPVEFSCDWAHVVRADRIAAFDGG